MSDDQQTCRYCGNSFVMGACGPTIKHWPEYCSSDCMYLAEIARLRAALEDMAEEYPEEVCSNGIARAALENNDE